MIAIIKKYGGVIFISLLFGIIYSLISLVNHYYFRTFALDLGTYTNALYDYIHFQWNDSGVFKEIDENLLADHFDLFLVFFSPFSLVFGTYTLLIVQIVAILFGGIGVYTYFTSIKKNIPVAFFAMTYFYVFFGVFSALSFDYHSNVVSASLVPWLFYLVARRKLLYSSILLLLIIVSKENMAFWLFFVCIGLAIEHRMDKYLRNYLVAGALGCIVSFLLITAVIMPSISNEGSYPHFNYSFLGNNYLEAFVHLISHPFDSMGVMFTNHVNHPQGDYLKAELHILLLTSGILFLLKKPVYIFMLLPIYFQKLFHDNCAMWGIGNQYCIEFTPILAIGIFTVITEFRSGRLIKYASIVVLILATASTIRTMDNAIYYTDKARIRFYQERHYNKNYNIKSVHQQLSKIPQNAIVSSQTAFLPHLALRDDIYQFPIIKDAEYIVYSDKEGTYPLPKHDFDSITDALEHSKNWAILFKDDITILKKISM